tara:strand:- start:906 stop:1076 length:171 start_codon:yes stop_codon:yes gene_type:complete
MKTKNYKIGDIIGEGATRLKITGFERMNKKTYFRVETLTHQAKQAKLNVRAVDNGF